MQNKVFLINFYMRTCSTLHVSAVLFTFLFCSHHRSFARKGAVHYDQNTKLYNKYNTCRMKYFYSIITCKLVRLFTSRPFFLRSCSVPIPVTLHGKEPCTMAKIPNYVINASDESGYTRTRNYPPEPDFFNTLHTRIRHL